MYWIVPSNLASSRIFFGLAPVIRSLAWLALLVFGITTIVAYARSRLMAGSRKSRGDGRGGLRPMREPSLDMPFTQTTNTQSASSQRQTLGTKGWGASNQYELIGSVSTIRTDRRKLRKLSGYVESDPIYYESDIFGDDAL
jgi:hypothetical protein